MASFNFPRLAELDEAAIARFQVNGFPHRRARS
jgi:hypothetical protein